VAAQVIRAGARPPPGGRTAHRSEGVYLRLQMSFKKTALLARRAPARSAAAALLALVLAGCAGNLECDGHACVGDWKRDMALGGTVVQCADGDWSHAGGLGKACAGHGGKSVKRRR
jgi:hypothetical protein